MVYSIIKPPQELNRWVRHYWFIEQQDKLKDRMTFKFMAEGFPHLIFQYDSSFQNEQAVEYPSIILYGHSGRVTNVQTNTNFAVCGIAFYATAVKHLLGISACEMADVISNGEFLLSGNVRELADQIFHAVNNDERATLFTKFLVKRIRQIELGNDIADNALRKIIRHVGTKEIEILSEELNLSRRQLERKFLASVGFTPKQYSRIIRFQSSLLHKTSSIAKVAFSHGYADQSHFIREFRAFSGMSPKLYFREQGEAAENFVKTN